LPAFNVTHVTLLVACALTLRRKKMDATAIDYSVSEQTNGLWSVWRDEVRIDANMGLGYAIQRALQLANGEIRESSPAVRVQLVSGGHYYDLARLEAPHRASARDHQYTAHDEASIAFEAAYG
jgi:hypothetical protein